jgi:hypothetical protein
MPGAPSARRDFNPINKREGDCEKLHFSLSVLQVVNTAYFASATWSFWEVF